MALNTNTQPIIKHSFLANNLLRVVLSIYLLVAISITGLQLKIEYEITKKDLEYEIIFNGKSIIQPLGLALWNFDDKQINSIMEVIRENKNISHVEIIDFSQQNSPKQFSPPPKMIKHDFADVSIFKVTHKQDEQQSNTRSHSESETVYQFDIKHQESTKPIGSLYIYSKTSILYSKIKPLFLITLFNALIKIVVITIVFYIVFHQMVGKRLRRLQETITQFDYCDNASLDTSEINHLITSKNDELGDIFSSFQLLKDDIIKKNTEINNQKMSLEQSVLLRTQELETALTDLEKSNSFKSQFLANMSHEIRTPMNGILGVAELIRDTDLTEEQRNHINTILNSGHALTTIINDILDFSKIEAGKMQIESIDFNLRDLVDETLQLFRKHIQDTGIFLGTQIDTHLPETISGDPTRVRQILLNLIGNAFKFTKQGEIFLTISIIEHNKNKNKLIIKYAISDTGIGIDSKRQDELFNAFTQADTSISRNYGGTGLGLAISKRLSSLMHGEIGFESELEKGSTFWFTGTFYINDATSELMTTNSQTQEALAGKSILIIEPNLRLNKTLQIATTDWGLTTQAIDNPLDDNQATAKKQYDFIVINNDIPKINTFHYLEHALLNTHMSEVILISKLNAKIDKSQLNQFGIHHVMSPPITANKLKKQLINQDQSTQSTTLNKNQDVSNFDDLNILIAEDNHVNQVVIKGFLKKLNISPTICENGLLATQHVQKNKFNIILMDCEMPIMDGYEATRKIKNEHPNIIIIGLSAHALEEHKTKALDAGMDDYITKPIKRAELIEKLKTYQAILTAQK